jgi:hypothetical protein
VSDDYKPKIDPADVRLRLRGGVRIEGFAEGNNIYIPRRLVPGPLSNTLAMLRYRARRRLERSKI